MPFEDAPNSEALLAMESAVIDIVGDMSRGMAWVRVLDDDLFAPHEDLDLDGGIER